MAQPIEACTVRANVDGVDRGSGVFGGVTPDGFNAYVLPTSCRVYSLLVGTICLMTLSEAAKLPKLSQDRATPDAVAAAALLSKVT